MLCPFHSTLCVLILLGCCSPGISCHENHFKTYLVQKSLPDQGPNYKQITLWIEALMPWPFTHSFIIQNESKITIFSDIQGLRVCHPEIFIKRNLKGYIPTGSKVNIQKKYEIQGNHPYVMNCHVFLSCNSYNYYIILCWDLSFLSLHSCKSHSSGVLLQKY